MVNGAAAEIKSLKISKKTVSQYEMVEISVGVSPSFNNPNDSRQVDIVASITMPNDRRITIPAFYSGTAGIWKVRYTPSHAGKHSYAVLLKSRSQKVISEVGHFNVTAGASDGFLRRAGANPFYPVFDSGRSFFGIGHNTAWVPNSSPSAFDGYFKLMAENGCNLTRIWMNNPWSLPFEDKKIGSYNQKSCEALDSILEHAAQRGIYIILTFDSYGAIMEEPGFFNESWWNTNPYNKANGGPCAQPPDFFTDESAKQHYKNRLRYIMARWGYSPNILAFEFWNEANAPADWTSQMADYIRAINPHRQLITTSLGYPWGDNFDEISIFRLEQLDIIDRHIYSNQSGSSIEKIISMNREMSSKYNKMLIVGEYGISAAESDKFSDEAGTGQGLHNSIWACAMSRSFSSALNWWWDDYVRPKNLYPHYRALRNFVNGVDWASSNVEFASTTPVKQPIERGKKDAYKEVSLPTHDTWGDMLYREFAVTNSGELLGGQINMYLQGELHKDIRINPVFRVDYHVKGKFIVKVGIVSKGATLVAYLDGKEVLRRSFTAGPGEGPWQKSLYRKDFGVYQCVYNTPVEIDVPEGEHTIRLSNVGEDWIGIKRITLTNYRPGSLADVRVAGLKINGEVLLWLHDKSLEWQKAGPAEKITDASFTVDEIKNGLYTIEWWDTYEGKVISSQTIEAAKRSLELKVPPFSKDIACKIKPKE